MLRFFSYSYTVSDGSVETTAGRVVSPCSIMVHPSLSSSNVSEGTTAGRVVSPCSIMVHHSFRSKKSRRARKQKYLLCQTTSRSSLLVARRIDVPRKLNQAKIATMNCRTLSNDVRVKELQQLASDMSIDVLAVQEHKRTSLDVHRSLLLPGWQFLLKETPSPGWVASDTFCHLVP